VGQSPSSTQSGRESEIDREVKHLIDNAHHIAQAILADNQQLLGEVAQVLLEREILEGQQLHGYLGRVKIPPLLATWLQTGELAILVPFAKRLPAQRGSANDPLFEEQISVLGNGLNPKHLPEH
jgi:hypothetical protein